MRALDDATKNWLKATVCYGLMLPLMHWKNRINWVLVDKEDARAFMVYYYDAAVS